tara:strand:+ start:45605 stop:45970 length:366 start_codon:yes stop_codon:yes gene_type:complete
MTAEVIEDNVLELKLDNPYLSYILEARNNAVKWMKHLYVIGILYFIWITVHFFSSNLYVYYCTPFTLTGFIQSPFLVLTPHCIALRWLSYKGSEQIASMWSILGVYLLSIAKEYLIKNNET